MKAIYLKFFRVIAVAIFISVKAKRLPMHMRGPAVRDGIYSTGTVVSYISMT